MRILYFSLTICGVLLANLANAEFNLNTPSEADIFNSETPVKVINESRSKSVELEDLEFFFSMFGASQPMQPGAASAAALTGDIDTDGVLDSADLDDDNDGVLDSMEFNGAFIDVIPVVGENFITSGTHPTINKPALDSSSGWAPPSSSDPTSYAGVTFDNPSQVISFTTQGRNDGIDQWVTSYRLELSKDNINWVDIGDFTGNTDKNTKVTNTVSNTDDDWVAFRLIPLTFNTFKIMRFGVSVIDNTLYDVDQDGTPNHEDLDSDGDGCSDAYEAGATNDDSVGFSFPSTTGSGDSNSNGLADIVENGTSGDINYSSTYLVDAINNVINSCADLDVDGVGDLLDLDDDNDGVLDSMEYNEAFIDVVPVIGANFISSGDHSTINQPALNSGSAWAPPTSSDPLSYAGVYFNNPSQVVSFTTQGRADGAEQWVTSYRLELTKDSTNWVDIGDFTGNGDRNTEVTNFVSNSDNDWVGFRLIPLSFNAYKSFRFGVAVIDNVLYDVDQDGTPNHRDLDSDGDGCSDAFEAGATEDNSTDFQFVSTTLLGDSNANGLADDIEEGTTDEINYISSYSANSLTDTVNSCDSDLDGIINENDLDYDNDGVLNTTEFNGAFSDVVPVVGVNFISNATHPTINKPALDSSSGWAPPSTTDATSYAGVQFEAPTRVFSFTTQGRNDGVDQWVTSYRLELTKDNTNWVDMGDFTGNTDKNTKVTNFVSNTDDDWVAFRLIPLTYNTFKIMRFGVTIIDNSLYDLDQDGTPNYQDLDSDGDGCSDAFEAGATADNTVGFAFATTTGSGDANSNGLADVIEDGTSGTTNYTSTYTNYALNNEIDLCFVLDNCFSETDCDGDGYTDAEEASDICGFGADPYDYHAPFQHWETTQNSTELDASFLKISSGLNTALTFSNSVSLSVKTGDTLSLSGDIILRDLTLDSGSGLNLNGNKITVYGDLAINGELVHDEGHIHMLGTGCAAQSISGSGVNFELHDLTIENDLGVTLQRDLLVSGTIFPELGDFDLNGNTMKLISLPINGTVSTGSIAEIKSEADVIGDITIQRYVESMEDGYRFLAVPIKNLTVASLADDMITTGFTGSDYPNHSFTNVKYYKEDQRTDTTMASGYKNVQNISDALVANHGYWAYFPPSVENVVLDAVGEFNKGDVTMNLSYTSSANSANDGWHCIVNPYPSAIDLTSNCVTFNNVGSAIYIIDPTIGSTWQGEYVTYNDGVSVNGGTGIISSFQAFMVKATGPGASITFNECAKTNVQGTFYRSGEEENNESLIRLALQRDDMAYETVISFNENATVEFDPEHDATMWDSEMFSVASVMNGTPLNINAIPADIEEIEIPLRISAPEAGEYELVFKELKNVPSNYCLHIKDLETGEITFLEEGNSITLTTDEENYSRQRYMLSYKAIADLSTVSPHCFNDDSGSAEIVLKNEAEGSFEWYDNAGNLVLSDYGVSSRLEGVTSGLYTVDVFSANTECGSTTIEVYVKPAKAEIVEISSTPDYCSSGFGNLKVNVRESDAWTVTVMDEYELIAEQTSSSLVDIDNLTGKVYDVIVETSCFREEYVLDLTDPAAVKANFERPEHIIIQNIETEVEIEALSENADNHQWFLDEYFKGDEDVISLTFDQVGSYTLRLNSSNEHCEDDFEQELMVSAATVIEDNLEKDFLTINKQDEIVIMRLNDGTGNVDITLYDIKGAKVVELLATSDQRISISKEALSQGVYVLEIRTEQGEVMSSKYAK